MNKYVSKCIFSSPQRWINGINKMKKNSSNFRLGSEDFIHIMLIQASLDG